MTTTAIENGENRILEIEQELKKLRARGERLWWGKTTAKTTQEIFEISNQIRALLLEKEGLHLALSRLYKTESKLMEVQNGK